MRCGVGWAAWLLLLLLRCARAGERCEVVRARCAYRVGCGMALHSYMLDCADVMAGRVKHCPAPCQRALIALTSTAEGEALMDCECRNSEFCQVSKERVEVCRPAVMRATAPGVLVSCSVARWICAADSLCSTALDYYHRLCRSLLHGHKCTPRCNNSLAILDRQQRAAKLRDCFCDGTEDFPCRKIRDNTQRLCYGRTDLEVLPEQPPVTAAARLRTQPGSLTLQAATIPLFLAWRFQYGILRILH